MKHNFKKVSGGDLNNNNNQDLEGGFSLTRLFTGNLYNNDYVADFETQEAWDDWFEKIKKRHINLFVLTKNDPKYKPDKSLEEDEIDPYSNFLMPSLLEEYNFSNIINILKDYYNFENGNWNTYKGENIGRQFKEDNIKPKGDRWLTSGRVQKVIQSLIDFLNKQIKDGKGDKDEYEGGIRMIKQALEESPFKTFKTKMRLEKTQEQQIKKADEKIQEREEKEKKEQRKKEIADMKAEKQKQMADMKAQSKGLQKTNNEILEEVKKIRNEINRLTIALQQTNAKISSDNKQPPELKRKDLRSENKTKADKIRAEIDDLVKQEAAIIKSLFDTNISRAKTTFREYL